MAGGGPRSGKPGATYSNRSDLSGDSSGGTYGDGVNQAAVRQATPNTTRPAPATPSPPPPGSLGPLTAPTSRPGEPITAGLSQGAGPGPEALGQTGGSKHDKALWELRALANLYPDNRDLMALIARAEARQ